MGKGAPTKKRKAPSIHSRAARRATSPTINTEPSLAALGPPPTTSNERPSVLAIHRNAGVTKRTKTGRKAQPSTRARRRRDRDADMALAIVERTEAKVQRSVSHARILGTRSRAWDEVNEKLGGQKRSEGGEGGDVVAASSIFDILAETNTESDDDDNNDADNDAANTRGAKLDDDMEELADGIDAITTTATPLSVPQTNSPFTQPQVMEEIL